MASATQLSLAELATRIGAEVRGDRGRRVSGVAGLSEAQAEQVAFYANPRYRKELAGTRAGAVIVAPDDAAHVPAAAVAVVAAQPYVAFAKASAVFYRELAVEPGVQRGALVDETAQVHPTAAISPGAYVGPSAKIGANTTLHAGARVLDCAEVGEGCILWPGAVVRERCLVGNRVILQPNCVVGSDGFGFAFDPEGDGAGPMHRKVPQAGIVRIEDDVEVGACTCIDRATLGETVIGRGTKIDNLVQVAHNVVIGKQSVIAAQAGISGSVRIGEHVAMAGQVGIVGHVTIGDKTMISPQSGVAKDISGGVWFGYPAVPLPEAKRQIEGAADDEVMPLVVRRGPEIMGDANEPGD